MTDTIITVDVPKTVVVSGNEIQVVEISASEDVVSVLTVGQQGPAGPGQQTYVHDQASPSSTWVVNHALDRYPSVSVVDSAGNTIICDAQYASVNSLSITFSAAFAGRAYLN